MKGNTSAVGNNQKSFAQGASVEKGADPMPRGRGQLDSTPMNMELKEFSKTETTACGVKK